ncbi:MAG: esterase [Chitinophagaceae bacterium]|nr:MAG: esterase [Chitinophagaceae bacterium]
MQLLNVTEIIVEKSVLYSLSLGRDVLVDFYLPRNVEDPSSLGLLLINDGQNMEELGLEKILADLYAANRIRPLLCAAIYTGAERKMEYGVASTPDYAGRGAKAGLYTEFILDELIGYIKTTYAIPSFAEQAFAGFSLGGLSALDIVFNHPDHFNKVGVFSGSFWWRSRSQDDPSYDDNKHRIMHQVVRHGAYKDGMKFFFQTGSLDETNDRNNNGVIDSIDDTMDLIRELEDKGYRMSRDINYLELPLGHHDIPTWAQAMPFFLLWGWGIRSLRDDNVPAG